MEVKKLYLDILKNGTDTYTADGTEMYMTTELNMLDKGLKAIFGQDDQGAAIDALVNVADEDKKTLYKDTMKFFEKLYGETSSEEEYTEDGALEGEMEGELEE